ncbi:MAG: MBG domain-containing protein, partial [Bacteroidales bacterium]|nr:MBG domain-containing protein [Bacteroidales bacterium]
MKTTCIFSIIIVMILFSLRTNAQNWDQIVKTCASDRNGEEYYGKSVAIDGDFAIVGAWGQDRDALGNNYLPQAGAAYILQNINDSWVEIQKITASDRASEDNFGYSVDIKGDYAVVGAWRTTDYSDSSNPIWTSGAVYVFYNNAGVWEAFQKITPLDGKLNQYFGNSVSIDGDFIVVGSNNDHTNALYTDSLTSAGSIYVFENNGTNWIQTQKIVPSDRAAADIFGCSVDICGDYIIAGAYNKHKDAIISAGAAYVFYYNGSTWTQIQKLLSTEIKTQGYFGSDVVINDSFAVVGARGEDENEFITNTGAAYIYSNIGAGATLSFSSKIIASDQLSNDNFGCSVDIDGNYIVVGAYNHSLDENGLNLINFTGAAYIYRYEEYEWTQEQKIVNLDRNNTDYFGYDVSISNNYIIAGAMYQDFDADGQNKRDEAGAAYIFHNCREIFVYQDTTEIEKKGTFDFGHIEIGSSSSELVFTIENTGVDNLILDGTPIVEIYGTNATDFTVNQSATTSPVIPGGTTTFTIIFTPSFIGLHTAEIKISNNDYDENPFVFTIIGIGAKIPQTISEFNPIDVKTYGDDDFIVSATASSGLDVIFTSSDNNIAICGGTNGSNITITGVGSCEIYANQPGNGIYLAAPQDSQTLIVNKKIITVTADAGQTKDYGDSDPVFTYTVNPGGLEIGDSFSGALTRVAGETVGVYEILIGSLNADPNYEITFIPDNFAIIERVIYVTADIDQFKIYGQLDPTLSYSYYPEIVDGDIFSGSLMRILGEDVGYYEIQQGSLSLNSNYIIDYTSNDFEVIAKTITVTPNEEQFKIYGTTDPSVFVYSIFPALVSGDTFSGSLERVAGEDVGFYAITLGTLDAGDNYTLTFVDEVFEIISKPISVIVYPDQSKLYGDSDPTFIYWLVGTLEQEDELMGELSREPGESLGFYAITQGTLSLGANYNLDFTGATFEIKVKGLSVQVDPNQTKEYGDSDPVFTYTINSSLASGDSFTGQLERVQGEDVGAYMITQGSLALNSNYSIVFIDDEFEITRKVITVTADPNQTKYYGEPNPDEYTYTYTGTLENGDSFSGSLTRE